MMQRRNLIPRRVQTARRQADVSTSLRTRRVWYANATLYGYVGVEWIADQTINNDLIPVIETAVRETYEEHNRITNALMDEWVTRTTEYEFSVELAASGELQPLDDKGNPLPTVPVGSYLAGLPLRAAGDAWGADHVALAYLTGRDTERFTLKSLDQDTRWLTRGMLAAFFTNVSYTFYDKRKKKNLTVLPLANNDTATYVKVGGDSSVSQHYLAQAAAIADGSANPFSTIYNTLTAYSSNIGPYVAYVASNLTSAIRGLANFIPAADTDVTYGADLTVLRAEVTTDNPTANSGIVGPGTSYLGKVDGIHIVEWRSLPTGYMIVIARGASDKILAMREEEAEGLRGLYLMTHSPDGNTQEFRYLRRAGFGVMNRIGAVVYQVGNGTYQIPAGYDARLLG